jgi:hypothetical protein
MDKKPFCGERLWLTQLWVEAAREHASAFTNVDVGLRPLQPSRSPGYMETVELLRIQVEDAMRALDEHRKQHG